MCLLRFVPYDRWISLDTTGREESFDYFKMESEETWAKGRGFFKNFYICLIPNLVDALTNICFVDFV